MTTIGILHPGQMGATIGAAATEKATVVWAGDGRSAASTARAEAAGLIDVGTVADLCGQADIIVSVCPPAAATDLAAQVADTGFDGIYVDANAISPATSKRIGSVASKYVDGGIIGPPAVREGTTRMYLAGPAAADLAALWAGSALDVRALTDTAADASASALKMAYAGWTKGQSALLLAINALAESAGVGEALRSEWELSQPGLAERSDRVAGGVSPKAWRFVGEMGEIAATMDEAGLPDGFHQGAADLYRRLESFKDQPGTTLEDVIEQLNQPADRRSSGS